MPVGAMMSDFIRLPPSSIICARISATSITTPSRADDVKTYPALSWMDHGVMKMKYRTLALAALLFGATAAHAEVAR
jgi:hypothetical protein